MIERQDLLEENNYIFLDMPFFFNMIFLIKSKGIIEKANNNIISNS